jgi:Transposase DDE domain
MQRQRKGQTAVSVIEQVAELAMRLSQRHLADYGAARSRHDFTQRQLMTCLILRAYLKTTYRGVLEFLAVSRVLRRRLGLEDKLPHFTTLQKFSGRSQVVAIAQKLIATIGGAAAQQATPPTAAAMDSTGLATTAASDYFRSRSGKRCRQWVKVSVVVLCGSLLPLGVVLDLGPSNDRVQVPALLDQAQAICRPGRLYADAGYDAEWIHVRCREQWQVESVIPPVNQRADGTRSGRWRAQMSTQHLQASQYGQRWAVESFFSALKRTMGATLNARRPDQMLAEAAFKILAYALRR